MKLRPILFWTHLTTGVVAGVIVLVMSVTGLLVTYEHAIIERVAATARVEVPTDAEPRTVDAIAARVLPRSAGARMVMLSYRNRADAPVTVYQVGQGQLSINPYTGADVDNPASRVEALFHAVIDWHRWLGMEGDGRSVGKAITGAANLAFLLLIATGLALWLPKVWRWVFVRANLTFARRYPTGRARDYNWHHVFGFWALLPLFLVVLSGVVISYPSANALLYRAFGEEAPVRQGPAFLSGGQVGDTAPPADGTMLASLQQAFEAASATDPAWTRINVILPREPDAPTVRLLVNNGGGILPEQRTTVTYDRVAASITAADGYDSMSAAQKARMWMRFVHTGEQYGLVGSTVAGLASIAACVLVYTGFALSWRRFTGAVRRSRKRRESPPSPPR